MKKIFLIILVAINSLHASENQTPDVSPVSTQNKLPFQLTIELTNLQIPGGVQSGATGQQGSKYLIIAGRTNGLHGFDPIGNFPPSQQNRTAFVVDTCRERVFSRSLDDPRSGLDQAQIETLAVVAPQSYQLGNTLYMTGGYGIDSASNTLTTKDTLSAIDVSGLIHWVTHPTSSCLASDFIRQIHDPVFQVTGGAMYQFGQCPTLLIFGQNFVGDYTPGSNGVYTQQVRRFDIIDNGKHLDVKVRHATTPDPNYRRRDLNVIPIIKAHGCEKIPAYVALSGVFTPDGGIWTVPVEITTNGTPTMADPTLSSTFKQAMNNYNSAHVELLAKNGDMYSILLGGITYGFFENGQFMTNTDFPFTNQITAIRRKPDGTYQQFLLPVEYPTILSTQSNPGKTLLFGAGARFIIEPNVPFFSNDVLDFASIKKATVIGYIVGGIESTLAETIVPSDSAASPYIFKVTIAPA